MIQNDYKPNINDLKQLFDDSKRLNVDKIQQHHFQQQQKNYFDAKPSYLEQEIFTDCKNRVDFERVKQKFDAKPQNNMKISNKFGNSSIPSTSSSSKQQSTNSNLLRKHPNTATAGSTKLNKTENLLDGSQTASTSSSSLNNKININETIQFFDNDPQSNRNSYLAGGKEENGGNFNLDGFKVSEDDVSEDEDDVSIA